MSSAEIILRAQGLARHIAAGGGRFVHAVDGVSLEVARAETLGLVGESGCGKTTLGRLLCRLEEPTAGRVEFEGMNLNELTEGQLRRIRPRIQMIFQDPFASLNPHKTVGQILGLPLRIGGMTSKFARRKKAGELLALVGLDPMQADRFPHQFSGGQRQRIGVARALASEPRMIIADEPVASLDVSIQAQILEILRELQARFSLTAIFISHDISVVSHVSRRIAVMYLGKIVEIGPAQAVIGGARHPYTVALLEAVPQIGGKREGGGIRLPGDPPSPMAVPPGCRFHTRCFMEQIEACQNEVPPLRELAPGHFAACHLAKKEEGASGDAT